MMTTETKFKVGDRVRHVVGWVGSVLALECPEAVGEILVSWDEHGDTGAYPANLKLIDAPAAEAKGPEPECSHRFDLGGRCVQCFKTRIQLAAAVPQPAAKVDPYEGRPDDETQRKWTDNLDPLGHKRARLVANLAAEMRIPGADRKRALEKRFGPRPGIDDWDGEP